MRRRQALLAVVALLACGKTPAASVPGPVAAAADATPADVQLFDVQLPDGTRADVTLHAGRVAKVATHAGAGAPRGWLVPAFIDSHVHLAFYPVGARLAARGFVAAVDLAAPEATLRAPRADAFPRLVASGPMLTAPGGYPLDAWGQDGYGVGCADAAAARAAVDRLAHVGAGVIKVALAGEDGLADAPLAAAVARAHELHLKVVAHALRESDAARAAHVGVDVLAHTPVEPLTDATVAAWRGRAVISTLAAFGGSADAVDNLRRLHAAGATVLYGTDLGNSQVVGVDVRELRLLAAAGLSADEILAAMTRVPAAYWGFAGLGSIAEGAPADVVLLAADPLESPETLASPARVFLGGVERK